MDGDGGITLNDITRNHPFNPEQDENVTVPKRLVEMLGATLAQWNAYFPKEMTPPSVGVSIRNRDTEE